jgi:hypothetical protein
MSPPDKNNDDNNNNDDVPHIYVFHRYEFQKKNCACKSASLSMTHSARREMGTAASVGMPRKFSLPLNAIAAQ